MPSRICVLPFASSSLMIACLVCNAASAQTLLALRDDTPGTSLDAVRAKLSGGRPVKIVCLGDSVTGVYYHTGGRRAYPEMIPLAIRGVLPQCSVTVVNAGISGHTTADGLVRLQKDVLDARPDLVTVMFGLNDMVRVPRAEFQANLARIIERCRGIGAEALLCTPNSVVDTPGRSRVKLADYCEAMREVGRRHSVAVCDIFAAHEAIRLRQPAAWRLLLSDEFHPNMDGHKLHAEEICRAIIGRAGTLQSAGPPAPAIPKTLALLAAGKPVRVLAMPPYDRLIERAIRAAVPSAKVQATAWPVEGRTLAQVEQAAQNVRAAPPDLVLIAVPAAVTPTAENPPEAAIRAYTWTLNWSLSFAHQEWDVVGIAPSALRAVQTADEKSRDRFARGRILAQDLAVISRAEGDASSPEQILADWLRRQLAARTNAR